MDLNLPRLVRFIGISLLLIGFSLATMGATLPIPDAEVTYVQEFNQEYAEENKEERFDIPFMGDDNDNISASEVHKVHNMANASSEVKTKFMNNIESENAFYIEENQTDYIGTFIVEFEDGSQYVFEGESDGIYPPRVFLAGVIAITAGFLVRFSIRGIEKEIPDGVEPSDDNTEWEYNVKK